MKIHLRLIGLVFAACLLAGCASDAVITDSRQLMTEGRGDEALAKLEQATRENPDNHTYRSEYFRQREVASAQWLAQADTLRLGVQYDPALELYRRVLKYDASNARAKQGLHQIEIDQRHRERIAQADKLVNAEKYREAQDLLAPVLVENPAQRDARKLQRLIDEKTAKPSVAQLQLKSSSSKPISLELRDVPVRTVFEVLGRATNLNFLFDRDVRADQKTTIVVRDAQVEDVIRLILGTNQLEQKVLNETTALIYPNTPQKIRDYQELMVKSFYISNADVKQTANLIRTILKTRDIFIDEKLNMLVMKDTPNAIRLAEKLIAAQDLADPEVMLEVEVLEIGATRLLNLGMQYPTSVAWGLVGGGTTTTTSDGTTIAGGTTTGTTTTSTTTGTPGVVSLPEWLSRSSNLVRLTFSDPLFVLNLQKQDSDTNLLANPRIRVRNREKAKIMIGDRVPVITTTAAATGGFVSQSVSYLDVGLKLEVEPLIYLDDDVGIKVGLEVSSITNTIQSTGGTLTYQIGTRNANTVLRLRDGETQILAGLINDEDRRTANKVPGLGDFPVLGRLFSNNNSTHTRTEIVLLITPRIVRTLARPDLRMVEFSAGTEASTSGGPLSGISATTPFQAGGTTSASPPGLPSAAPITQSAPTAPTPYSNIPQTTPPAPVAPESPAGGPIMVPFGGVQQ